jgi:2-keto-3-deoxy-L-rhamnonate aldolase RhmA
MSGNLRERVTGGETVLGVFVRTPAHEVGEVLGHAGLDFAIVDAEHAPFDVTALDRVVLGAAAGGLPCLVRPPDLTPAFISRSMDLGAAGVLAPHVIDGASAARVVAAARYGPGKRGFSPSTRAGRFGTEAWGAYRARADAEISVWCQIEDAEALDRLDEIAATDGVDCLFLGRADLALSLGVEGSGHPRMVEAIAAVADAARRHGRALGVFMGDTSEMAAFLELGARVLVVGSDQGWLMSQGRSIREALDGAAKRAP